MKKMLLSLPIFVLALGLMGCPRQAETNMLVLRNALDNDRLITGLAIEGAEKGGINLLPAPLATGQEFALEDLEDGAYNIEVTFQRQGDRLPAVEERRQVLEEGNTYTWFFNEENGIEPEGEEEGEGDVEGEGAAEGEGGAEGEGEGATDDCVISGTFEPLGDFEGGAFSSVATGVSADGDVAVGYGTTALREQGFRHGTVLDALNPSFALPTYPNAVSGDGQTVVGQFVVNTTSRAFAWTAQLGMTELASIGALYGSATLYASSANGVSADGSVMVGEGQVPNGTVALRWVGEELALEDLGTLPTTGTPSSAAFACSADGNVVVGMSTSWDGEQAFRWTAAEGMRGLGYIEDGSNSSTAWACSADGNVVVGTAESSEGRKAFYWSATTGMIDLAAIAGEYAEQEREARSVSGDGRIVVGMSVNGNSEPFIWDRCHGIRHLKDVLLELGVPVEAWVLANPVISQDGTTLVGGGFNASGQAEAWRVVFSQSLSCLADCGF